mmetsp:Transcript_34400/g.57805  ORF Transcript_34400/g.57805 Transcript_34400/m.57805 type:complete len:137 (+) Transcript_34400:196-606(+)
MAHVTRRSFSVTYSGGQASVGQGGFYGSGGSRATNKGAVEHHPEALVENLEDLKVLKALMSDIEVLEDQLATSIGNHGSSINEQSIELKAALRRKASGQQISTLLKRLEINGEPRWGLSASEREVVVNAREKFNSV